MGRVHYLTTQLTFPQDMDVWVKQDPIAGASAVAIFRFIKGLNLEDYHKSALYKKLETSWKDHNGVWFKLKIETTKRTRKWGDQKTTLKMLTR